MDDVKYPPSPLSASVGARVYAPQARRPHAVGPTETPASPLASLRIARRAGSHNLRAGPPSPTTAGPFITRLATTLLALMLLPQAQAQFVSVCGSAPSGLNDCPWYQVEIVIFRNDNARAVSAEDLASEAQPRWSPRLATLLPPAGEAFKPMRTAEYLALWQSPGQAPEWLQVTPGLTMEQQRFLITIANIGQARHPVDLDFLQQLDQLAWQEASAQDDVLDDTAGPESGARPLPGIEPVVVIAQPTPELRPRLALVEAPDMTGAIPMDLAFREVPAGQRLLDGEAARLRRARGFEVLGQLAWRQPFAPNEAGLAQLIYSADIAETGLAEGELLLGTLTVDLRRFLHAHLDLYFKAESPPLDDRRPAADSSPDSAVFNAAEANSSEDNRPEDSVESRPYALEQAPQPQWVHIKQSRRMRSGELHYLDHPWIGAIIRIERYEAPAATE